MYQALARAVLDDTDRKRAAARVAKLRRRHPRLSRDELADRLLRRTALQCAAGGALLSGPAAFFGAMPFGADLGWQLLVLNRLVLSLAALYGAPPSPADRLAGVGAAAAAGLGSDLLRQGLVRLLRRLFPRTPAARTAAGALAGAALGYAGAMVIGRFAQDSLKSRSLVGRVVRGVR